jgi:hypothetical protein
MISGWAGPVAEDDGLEQRGPAEPVDVVDVDVRSQQLARRRDVTAVGGGDQRGAAEAVRGGQVGARAQERAEGVDVTREGGGGDPRPSVASRSAPRSRRSRIRPASPRSAAPIRSAAGGSPSPEDPHPATSSRVGGDRLEVGARDAVGVREVGERAARACASRSSSAVMPSRPAVEVIAGGAGGGPC